MLETVRREDDVVLLAVTEPRLDALNAPGFKDAVAAVIAGGDTRLVLDLSAVEFVDSSGLGALVAVLKRLGARGDLALAGVRPAVERTFKLTRMDRVFAIHPDAEAALAQIRG